MKLLTSVVLAVLCSAAPIWAQATAQIQGVVQDSTGGAVPGVEVKVTQTDTGITRTTTSSADGTYVLASLPTGPYTLEATKNGFATYRQTGIVLQVATSPTIDVSLRVGSVNESVQVEANASLVETQTTGVGSVIENQRILELPLNGRNPVELIQLAGASVNQGVATSRGMQGGVVISVAGGLSFGVSYMLDGANHNNPFDNLNLPLPFPDALQEFKVETSALTAQNGGHSGAAVSSVTKSGTNETHGDLFWFVRNGKFNARNFFALRNDSLKRNQYGGTLGGPIVKNKLFYFAGYQGTKIRQDPSDQTSFLPTQAMLNGDFTAYASAACNNGRNVLLQTPGQNRFNSDGKTINPSFISPVARAIIARVGTASDPCGRVLWGARVASSDYQLIGRTDYSINEKHTIFGRYIATTYFQNPPNSFAGSSLLATVQGGRDNLSQGITFGDTYLISPTMVNSFRAVFNRTALHRTNVDYFEPKQVGVQNVFSYVPNYMIVAMGAAGFNLGAGTEDESTFRTVTYQATDDFSIVKGSHQIAFGINQSQWRTVALANVRSPGTFTFDGSATGVGNQAGLVLADFLTGYLSGPNAFFQAAPNNLFAYQWYTGIYAQDTWKVNQRLTLNYGLRWEPWFPQQLTQGTVYNFDLAAYDKGTRTTKFNNAPPGFSYPGDPGFKGNSGMNKRPWNLAPRIGLAYDPKGDGKMSIRASYGLAYDYINGQFYLGTAIAPPWGAELRFPGPIRLEDPYGTSGQPNIFPITFNANAPFPRFAPFQNLQPDQKTSGVHGWNLSIQRQITSAWFVQASYVGSQAQHLWMSTQGNLPQIIPGPIGQNACAAGQITGCNAPSNLNFRRPLYLRQPTPTAGQLIGFLDPYDDGGTQSYNGLLLSAQRRFLRGLSMNMNYTWSHCIGDFTQGGNNVVVGTGYLDPNNRRLDRGNCQTDRRHIANLTAVAEAPRFNNTTTRMAVSGWRLSGIYRFSSGAPMTVVTNDRQFSGNAGQRPNLLRPDAVYGDGTPNNFLNRATDATAAFGLQNFGTLGNLGRFSLFGPSFWTIDMALSRNFKITERQSLEVRGEAFNLTNSLRMNAPALNFQTPATFGRVLSGQDPRIMQFAMKYVF